MSVGDRIRKAREKLGLSQAQLASRVGVTRTAIGQWEGDETVPRAKHAPKLSAVLELPLSAFSPFGGGTVMPLDLGAKSYSVPLLDWADLKFVMRGKVMVAKLKKPTFVMVNDKVSEESFALTVMDDSMAPLFRAGDEIVVDSNVAPRDGDCIVTRMRDGDSLFRTYRERRNGAYDLIAENPEWPTVTINSATTAEILGVMVEHRRKRQRG